MLLVQAFESSGTASSSQDFTEQTRARTHAGTHARTTLPLPERRCEGRIEQGLPLARLVELAGKVRQTFGRSPYVSGEETCGQICFLPVLSTRLLRHSAAKACQSLAVAEACLARELDTEQALALLSWETALSSSPKKSSFLVPKKSSFLE